MTPLFLCFLFPNLASPKKGHVAAVVSVVGTRVAMSLNDTVTPAQELTTASEDPRYLQSLVREVLKLYIPKASDDAAAWQATVDAAQKRLARYVCAMRGLCE